MPDFMPEIDAEHKTLFRMGEELQQAMEAGASTAELEPRLKVLVEHAEAHFEHEERLMRESICPSFEWHKGQHNTARKRLRRFIPEIQQGSRESLRTAPRVSGRLAQGSHRPHRPHHERPCAELSAGRRAPGFVSWLQRRL